MTCSWRSLQRTNLWNLCTSYMGSPDEQRQSITERNCLRLSDSLDGIVLLNEALAVHLGEQQVKGLCGDTRGRLIRDTTKTFPLYAEAQVFEICSYKLWRFVEIFVCPHFNVNNTCEPVHINRLLPSSLSIHMGYYHFGGRTQVCVSEAMFNILYSIFGQVALYQSMILPVVKKKR